MFVSVSVCHFEDEMTRDRSSESINGLGTSCFQVVSSAIAYNVFLSLCIKLQPFPLCWENFEELSVAN